MTTSLHVRDLPDDVHEELRRRAARRGMSLRRYTIEVLTEHCAMPTMDEWLDSLHELPRAEVGISGAEAVREARAEDEARLDAALRR